MKSVFRLVGKATGGLSKDPQEGTKGDEQELKDYGTTAPCFEPPRFIASAKTDPDHIEQSKGISWAQPHYAGRVAGDGAFAYSNGEAVEYFSSTHRQWLLGRIQVIVQDDFEGECPQVKYSLKVSGSTQIRENVPLDCLRRPFGPNELLDAFIKRDGGKWVQAESVGRSPLAPVRRHYRVRMCATDDQEETIIKIPAVRLRRRFPAGAHVEVYRGPPHGWVPAVVHSSITKAPEDPPVPLTPFSPGGTTSSTDTTNATSSPLKTAEGLSRSTTASTVCSTYTGDEGLLSHPWVEVPVFEEEWDHWLDLGVEEKAPEWIPSYLVRSAMVRDVTPDCSQRRVYVI